MDPTLKKLITFFYLIDCKNQGPEGQMGTLMGNMVLFSKTLLRKLYGGSFIGDSKIFLEFFADQIMVVRKKIMHIFKNNKESMFSPK